MNIYEKLNSARVAFQGRGVKMSGKNTFAGYGYYELGDILPAINTMACEIGFICEVSFTPDLATLTVRDTEKPQDVIAFTSPMSSASLKGCHEVQNLGAVETYIKRYLYQNAFEIVESDQVNKTHNPEAPTAQEQCAKLSADLKLTDEEKRQMWTASGLNHSNLLILLKDLNKEKGNV